MPGLECFPFMNQLNRSCFIYLRDDQNLSHRSNGGNDVASDLVADILLCFVAPRVNLRSLISMTWYDIPVIC